MTALAAGVVALGLVGCGSESTPATATATTGLPPTFVPLQSTTTTIDPYGVIAVEADGKVLAAIEADRSGADAMAGRILAELGSRRCVPASTVDLGPLTSAGDWNEVCVGVDGDSLSITGVDHVPNITFGPTHPYSPDTCYGHLVGNWWSWYSGSGDAMTPCMPDYTFQGA